MEKLQTMTINSSSLSSEKIIRHVLTNASQAISFLEMHLKAKGFTFQRDYEIGNYCFDFFNSQYNIAIEIDGYINESYDVFNTDQFKKLNIHSLGITVFRFTDYQILTDIEEVIRAIKNHIKAIPS